MAGRIRSSTGAAQTQVRAIGANPQVIQALQSKAVRICAGFYGGAATGYNPGPSASEQQQQPPLPGTEPGRRQRSSSPRKQDFDDWE